MFCQCLLFFMAMVAGEMFISAATVDSEQPFVVSYEEIKELAATCPGKDTCTEDRYGDNLKDYNCHCEEHCTRFGSCCVDSKYRDNEFKTTKQNHCVQILKSLRSVFMIGSCDSNWFGDNETEELCTGNYEEKNDLFLTLPITNHVTGVTYRNYFCAICNNDTDQDQLTLWPMTYLTVESDVESLPMSALHYNHTEGEWLDAENDRVVPTVHVPEELHHMIQDCEHVISSCAEDWNDTIVEAKCAAYMAIIRTGSGAYKNPHCVICNHESLQDYNCNAWKHKFHGFRVKPSNTFFVRLFSFYDKEGKCTDNQIYDTLARKCRKVYKG